MADGLSNRKRQLVVINETPSNQSPVKSHKAVISEPSCALCMTYINDINFGFKNSVAKFPDDTKIGNLIITDSD